MRGGVCYWTETGCLRLTLSFKVDTLSSTGILADPTCLQRLFVYLRQDERIRRISRDYINISQFYLNYRRFVEWADPKDKGTMFCQNLTE